MVSLTIQQQLELALQHHQAGRLPEAERLYRQILAEEPEHPDALHLMGALALQTGRHDLAVDLIQRVIALMPDFPDAHFNLGNALKAKGQLGNSIAAYRQAVTLDPDYAEAYNNLGIALKENGQLNDSIAAYQQAIALDPEYANAHNNLGIALKDNGQIDEAITAFSQAIAIGPDSADMQNNLGITLHQRGRLDEAIAAFSRAIAIKPDNARVLCNLATTMKDKGQLSESIAAYRQAIALLPGLAEAHNNLGLALQDAGEYGQAIESFRNAIQFQPDFAQAYNNLGSALAAAGQIYDAIAAYRQSLTLEPGYAEAHSNILFSLNYDPTWEALAVAQEHSRWSEIHAAPLGRSAPALREPLDANPDRCLRIGYVSADFHRHAVMSFFMPLLENHDRSNFRVFCYSNVLHPDGVTEKVKQLSDVWRNIIGVSDEFAVKQIRDDGVDILVDLSGHTARNRLLVFARKPAPVQVTYLGYPNTTGMDAIDYRLTDALADPPGMTEHLNAEQLWRLPICAWCFQTPDDSPPIQRRRGEPLTFGCFNTFRKITANMVELWGALLGRFPESCLLLKSRAGADPSVQKMLQAQFAAVGIRPERIEMLGWIDKLQNHLEHYNRVDIALDTHPYHGTTTTCEALWMGVPVVTLMGSTHVSRVGVSLLANAGRAEWVASSPEEYLRLASELAGNPSRRTELRANLRGQLQRGPLLDAKRFTSDVEAAYRQMWHAWCASDSKISG